MFVTPTWPRSPRAARLAFRLALEHERIQADAIESVEFPELVAKYRVYAVPKTVINEIYSFEGAMTEEAFTEALFRTLSLAETQHLAAGQNPDR